MERIKLPPDIEGWLNSFVERHGRRPRLLHIGNIANNAYNNAKLLNEAGLDCDVICHDYYHIMGCPEWEDADFEGSMADQFLPDWDSVDLKGYRRPRWFVQGPFAECFRYLMAQRSGNVALSDRLWRSLNERESGESLDADVISPTSDSMNGVTSKSVMGLKRRLRAQIPEFRFIDWKYQVADFRQWGYPVGALCFYALRAAHDLLTLILLAMVAPFVLLFKLVCATLGWIKNSSEHRTKKINRLWKRRFEKRVEELVMLFAARFPDRKDQLSLDDLEYLRHMMPKWAELFQQYDIIQGYSTDPIYPLVAGRPYFAFEHGTLREIPEHETSQGRCTALAYSQAVHVFVTNSDCVDAAKRLAGEKFSFLNHPYDEDHGVNLSGWEELRSSLMRNLDADFLFFFPTRHDWVAGTGYADKANDVFLRAFCQLRESGYRVGLICCRWGANVEHSQELIAQYGFAKHVLWYEPMGIVRFERTAKAAHIVVDQFKLGAFGGILFKAMSLGVPMCTFLDEDEMVRQFGEAPPVINCRTENEIISKITPLIHNPVALSDLSMAGRRWIKQHHASANTVIAQLSAYMKFLKLPHRPNPAAAPSARALDRS